MLGRKTALSLAIIIGLSSCGEKLNENDYLAQAKQYQSENKLKETEIALKNAIQIAPNNAEVRLKLGQLYLSQGESAGSIKELEKAQSLKYTGRELIPLLARAYLISEDNEAVIDLAPKAADLPAEHLVQYLSYSTLAFIRVEDNEQATAQTTKANSLLPDNPHTILANAYVAMIENDLSRAEALATKSLAREADNPEAVMLMGQILTSNADFDGAAEQFEKYAVLQPQSKLIYLLLADTLVKTDRYLEAEKYADMVLSALPQQPVANYVKAVVRFAEKDYEVAQKFAETGLNSQYMRPHLRLVAGASSFYQANYEQANAHLGAIINQLNPDHAARKMYAVSQFHLGEINNISEALQSYTPVTEEDQEFMSSLSFSLFNLGAKEEAKQLAEQAASTNIDTATAAGRKGILKLMMNDSSGVEDLEDALAKNPDLVGAELALAYVALERGDIDKAIEVATTWQEKYPEKSDGYNLAATAYMRQDKLAEATTALNKSLKITPNNIFALTELTSILMKQGEKDQADVLAKKAVRNHPNNVKALHNNYSISRNDEALAAIEKAFGEAKDKNLLAELYMQALLDQEKLNEMLKVVDSLTLDFKTPKRVWQLQIVAYQKQQKGDLIKATLDKWAEANQYHIEPVFLLADYYVKSRQSDRAISTINKALSGVHNASTELKLVKMQLLLDNRKVAEAKRLYSEVSASDIDENIKAGITGRINLLEKKYSEALVGLKPYYDAFPSSQNAVLLAVARNASGNKAMAISGLEKHLESNSKDLTVKNLLANYYVDGDRNKALQQYKQLVAAQPLNVVALNNLAWLSMENNAIEDALKYVVKAYELAPKVPNIVDTYAKILAKKGSKREALNRSKEAYELSQGKDIDITLNYIEQLLSNSRKNEAKSLLMNVKPQTESQKEKTSDLLNQI